MKVFKIILTIVFILLIAFFIMGPAFIDKKFNPIKPIDFSVSDSVKIMHNEMFVADLHNDILLWGRAICW